MKKILLISLIAICLLNYSFALAEDITVVADWVTSNWWNINIWEAWHETLAKWITVWEWESKTVVNDDCKNNPDCKVSAWNWSVVTQSLWEWTRVDWNIPLNSAENKKTEDMLASSRRLPQTWPEYIFLVVFAIIIWGLLLRKEKMFKKFNT